jgi:hypothetical protein
VEGIWCPGGCAGERGLRGDDEAAWKLVFLKSWGGHHYYSVISFQQRFHFPREINARYYYLGKYLCIKKCFSIFLNEILLMAGNKVDASIFIFSESMAAIIIFFN